MTVGVGGSHFESFFSALTTQNSFGFKNQNYFVYDWKTFWSDKLSRTLFPLYLFFLPTFSDHLDIREAFLLSAIQSAAILSLLTILEIR